MKKSQALITRLPYAQDYNPEPILRAAQQVDERGLICISIPIHVDAPNNGGKLIYELEKGLPDKELPGLFLVAKIAWYRDRHIVTTKSRRLTNTWEPLVIMSRSPNYIINRDSAAKIKKGFENREAAFDEEEYLTCIGDHWPVRNDRRDRRFLPQTVVLNCAQLADIHTGDGVLDPYGNPGVKDSCKQFDFQYIDGELPNDARDAKTSQPAKEEATDETVD
jgi:hypothetical protein